MVDRFADWNERFSLRKGKRGSILVKAKKLRKRHLEKMRNRCTKSFL